MCGRGTIRRMNTRILVFGDSIVYGAWDTAGGWVERVKAVMHRRTVESNGASKVQVLNMGVGGDSSTKILARLEHDIASRYSASWPCVLVFSFGANDERTKDGVVETQLEQFEQNSTAILDIARRYTDKILFVGTAPIGEPTVKFKNQEYSDNRVRQYDEKLRDLVEALGIRYIPLRTVFETRGLDSLYVYDNIHCNDEGHALIAEAALPVLDEMLAD